MVQTLSTESETENREKMILMFRQGDATIILSIFNEIYIF